MADLSIRIDFGPDLRVGPGKIALLEQIKQIAETLPLISFAPVADEVIAAIGQLQGVHVGFGVAAAACAALAGAPSDPDNAGLTGLLVR